VVGAIAGFTTVRGFTAQGLQGKRAAKNRMKEKRSGWGVSLLQEGSKAGEGEERNRKALGRVIALKNVPTITRGDARSPEGREKKF